MKKLLSVLICVFCAVMLVGCGGGKMSQFVETNKGIFDFYETHLLDVQNYVLSEVSTFNAPVEDLTKINYALNGINVLAQEEMAIIAAIECYNSEQFPKEVYINFASGDGLIVVEQSNRDYTCQINLNGTQVGSYTFTISKDTEEYMLTYKKAIYDQDSICSAKVLFDQKVSRLKIQINSYNTDNASQNTGYGMVLESYKDFYALDKNFNAFQFSSVQGTENAKSIYTSKYYDEIGRYALKVSKLDDATKELDTTRINWDNFSTSQKNENCGYIAIYDSATAAYNLEHFGDVSVW